MQYSLIDAANDFVDLSNNIGLFKKKLCKEFNIFCKEDGVMLITPKDLRVITLDTIQQYLLSLVLYIRTFMELQKRINNSEEFLNILKLGVTKEQIEGEEGKLGLLYKFPIEALVTMIHFQIDSYFGQLCELTNDPTSGFYKRMTKVLKNIDKKEDYQNTLQCLANFRNSFHNQGIHFIHKKKYVNNIEPEKGTIDRTFVSNEFKIEFKHKEVIVYNWKSVYLLIKESVEILEKVIYENSKNIKAF